MRKEELKKRLEGVEQRFKEIANSSAQLQADFNVLEGHRGEIKYWLDVLDREEAEEIL